MKVTASKNGKTRITISKKEWQSIGKTAGWEEWYQERMKKDLHFPEKETKEKNEDNDYNEVFFDDAKKSIQQQFPQAIQNARTYGLTVNKYDLAAFKKWLEANNPGEYKLKFSDPKRRSDDGPIPIVAISFNTDDMGYEFTTYFTCFVDGTQSAEEEGLNLDSFDEFMDASLEKARNMSKKELNNIVFRNHGYDD